MISSLISFILLDSFALCLPLASRPMSIPIWILSLESWFLIRLESTRCGIVSIDTKLNESTKEYQLYSNCGRQLEDISLEQHVKESIEKGAGEIFINSIDRDGTMTGYDIDLIKKVFEYSSVPVIACGGAGNFGHMKDVFLQTGVSALACGSLFNFGDNNPIRAKAFLSNYGLPFKVI